MARYNGKKVGAVVRTAIVNLDLVYPIGSIYLSVASTNPHDLFGGTWEQIKDTFLLGAGDTYQSGDTGGEAEHTLSASEMPSHQHSAELDFINTSGGSPVLEKVDLASAGTSGSGGTYKGVATGVGWNNLVINTQTLGGGQAHNNMPPYLVVYMWKRTA